MYETYKILKIKEKAGVETVGEIIRKRQEGKCELSLQGINRECIYLFLTEEIKEKLRSVNGLYASITGEHKAAEVILLDAYHSATIEGARTTVENVRRSFDFPKTKDDKMVVNTVKAMNYAYEKAIDINNIRELWEIITKNVCENEQLAGKEFRSGMVYVGNAASIVHVPASPEQIEPLIIDMFEFLESSDLDIWIKAAVMHFYFVYIHPYCDGNGRTVRILTQSFLYHHGFDKIRYVAFSRAINDDLSGYYTALRDSEYVYANGRSWMDATPFVSYFLETLERALITSLQEDVKLSEKQKLLLKRMQKKGKNAEITVANAAKILAATEKTAARNLNKLVETGHLIKIKRGRKNIYILK